MLSAAGAGLSTSMLRYVARLLHSVGTQDTGRWPVVLERRTHRGGPPVADSYCSAGAQDEEGGPP